MTLPDRDLPAFHGEQDLSAAMVAHLNASAVHRINEAPTTPPGRGARSPHAGMGFPLAQVLLLNQHNFSYLNNIRSPCAGMGILSWTFASENVVLTDGHFGIA